MILPAFARRPEPEQMDAPDVPAGELRAALAFIARVNRRLGYTRSAARHVAGLLPRGGSVLDVCCGGGDLLARLARDRPDARGAGVDFHATTLALARGATAAPLVRGDARGLPLADGSVDVAACCMALHHFSDEGAAEVLRELGRVARVGVVAADLLRARRALGWITLFTVRSPALVKHDARASVRAAFTARELAELAERAGLRGVRVVRSFAHRGTIVWARPHPSPSPSGRGPG